LRLKGEILKPFKIFKWENKKGLSWLAFVLLKKEGGKKGKRVDTQYIIPKRTLENCL